VEGVRSSAYFHHVRMSDNHYGRSHAPSATMHVISPLKPDEDISAALVREMADQTPTVMVVAAAPDHRIVYANRAAHRAARGAGERLLGRVAAEAFAFVEPALLVLQRQGHARAVGVAVREEDAVVWWDVSYVALEATSSERACVLITAVDVTHHELAKARTQAAHTEERLRAVLLQIPAAIFILEAPDGRVAFKSRYVDELLGEPDIDLTTGETPLRGWAVHEDGSPYSLLEYPSRRALFHGETARAEPMAYRRGDGRLINLEMHAGPVRSDNGEIIAAVAVALNVTERHVTEARQAFLLRLHDALRTLTEPREILNAAAIQLGRYLGVARVGYTEMLPDDETILITNGYVDGVPPVNGQFPLLMCGAFYAAQMRQGKTLVFEDFQADERGADGMGLALGTRAHVSVPLVRHGRFTGSLYVTHTKPYHWAPQEIALIEEVAARIWDAAERGRAEARLRESVSERKEAEYAAMETAAKFEMLAQALPSMVWTSLPDGRIDWFNARVSEYCGIPAAEMKPDGWAPVHPDDVLAATTLYLEALSSGEPYVCEYRIRRHDGMFRWHITRAIPMRGADGRITRWIGVSADIQDQKSSEEALARLNSTLELEVRQRTADLLAAEATLRQSQKMEAVGQLTGGLAHDFNNLLTGITGSLELMAGHLRQGNVAQLNRYVHLAQGAAQRAAALTHRLLAFSRRQTLDPKPTDVNQLVYGMDELIRRTVGPAVAVKVVGAPRLWMVLADPNQLENALLNLCINARDAMPDGGSLVVATSNLALEDCEAKELELHAADYVLMSVSDTGGGMTADVVERAFDPFFTTKPIGEGTGLGLSMVYGFVRQSGGQARIHSQPGKGTQVCLHLPRYVGGGTVFEPSARAQRPSSGVGGTVLVVDDEPSVRTLIDEVLAELGYNVLQAEHGATGLQILQSDNRVDLLVTDVGLPGGMNGRQLADAARLSRPSLKVLFITGYAESAVMGAGSLKPGMHILTKPFSMETLGSRIREIIEAT